MTNDQLKLVNTQVGANIRAARESKGLSAAQLGEHMGVSDVQVSKYETGANRIAIARVLQIAAILKVAPSTLIRGWADVVANAG